MTVTAQRPLRSRHIATDQDPFHRGRPDDIAEAWGGRWRATNGVFRRYLLLSLRLVSVGLSLQPYSFFEEVVGIPGFFFEEDVGISGFFCEEDVGISDVLADACGFA